MGALSGTGPRVGVRTSQTDDEAVVNAAMLSFFDNRDWNDWWSKGDFVVVATNWRGTERAEFFDLAVLVESGRHR